MITKSLRTGRTAGTLAALSLALTATASEASTCKGGKSFTGGVPTPQFNWFCQNFTSGSVFSNRSLDDWRAFVREADPKTGGGAGGGAGGGGGNGDDDNGLSAEEIAALTRELADLENRAAALRKELSVDGPQSSGRSQLEISLDLEARARELAKQAEAAQDNANAAADKVAAWEALRYNIGGDAETKARHLAEVDDDLAAAQATLAARNGELAAINAEIAANKAAQIANDMSAEGEGSPARSTQQAEDELAETEQRIAEIKRQLAPGDETGSGIDVTATGLRVSFMNAPTPAPIDWTWWANGGLNRSDQSGGPTLTVNTSASFMTGLSFNPTPQSGLSFGLGYAYGITDETDTFGGGTTTSNTLKTRLTGYVTEGGVTFDGSATFDYGWNHRDRVWFTDDYSTHAFGLGAGVNGTVPINPLLAFDWRLGYAGTWTTRHASTDSTGATSTRATTALHRGSANGKLTYTLPDGSGSLYGEATLNAILADSSVSGRAASPFDLDLAAGGRFDIGSATIDLGASLGGIGRAGEVNYGLTAGLTIPF